jgi:NAD(P)-dependent dehydrogenase (short-subunit alcohol dehydrogenase family)
MLVAGAAGDIGQAVCRQAQEAGLLVVGLDIQPCPAELTVTDWHIADLTDGEVPDDLGEKVASAAPLRYVVHVVGGSDVDELREPDPARVPLDVFRRTVGLNLTSAYGIIRSTVAMMRAAREDRSYTLVSSANAFGGYGAPGYSAAKAGLHGLVRSLAVPLGHDGIRINAVALGTTQTRNYARLAEHLGRTPNFEGIGSAGVPRGSVLQAEEAATAILAVGVGNPAVSGSIVRADAAQLLVRPSTRR